MSIDIYQRVVERRLNFIEHMYRMNNKILQKTVVFGEMEGPNKPGRPD